MIKTRIKLKTGILMCIQREAVTVVEAAATYPDFTFPLCTAALWHLDCLHFSFFCEHSF